VAGFGGSVFAMVDDFGEVEISSAAFSAWTIEDDGVANHQCHCYTSSFAKSIS
jgi:hypothetical protein